MSNLYTVAVYCSPKEEYEVIVLRGKLHSYKKERIEDLIKRGFKLSCAIGTTNRESFLKYHLKARLLEFKNYRKKSTEELDRLLAENAPVDVLEDVANIVNDKSMEMMRLISRLVDICLMSDIEVTDELAILCNSLANLK